jgi:hypothetical protein
MARETTVFRAAGRLLRRPLFAGRKSGANYLGFLGRPDAWLHRLNDGILTDEPEYVQTRRSDMSWRFLTLALCLAATTAVASQTVQSPAPVYGAGSTTCATWLSGDRATRPDAVQMSWLLGYISAVGTTVKFQREARPEWVHGVIDGYCSTRPTETLAAAAQVLVRILQTPEPATGVSGGIYRSKHVSGGIYRRQD